MSSRPREGRVFLSYRRGDTDLFSHRLRDELVKRYGADHVFTETDPMGTGPHVPQPFARSLGPKDVVITLIGPHWLTATDPEGRRLLDRHDDLVRWEIESAIRQGVLLIPALVQGAAMPSPDELPEPLRPLAHRQAIELDEPTWNQSVQHLTVRLNPLLIYSDVTTQVSGSAPPDDDMAPRAEPPGAGQRRRRWFRFGSGSRGQRTAGEDEVSGVEDDVE